MAKQKEEREAPSKSLDEAIGVLNDGKQDCLVQRFGDIKAKDVRVCPSTIISLDAAMGCGGFPRGRVTEVYGPNSSGKTTSLLCAIGNVQAEGGKALFIDAEQRFDPEWARANGVDVDNLFFSQPPCGEEALQVAEKLIPFVDIAVIDSVAALVPRAELEGEMDDQFMGLQARLVGKGLRKIAGVCAKSNTAVIFTNQLRMKIGVMFGNPETTPGGEALKFWASMRIEIRRQASIKEGEIVVGARSKAKVVKNSCAAPFQEAEFDFYYGNCSCHGKGPDRAGDLLDVAEKFGIIEKSGAWYSFRNERVGQGRVSAANYLREHSHVQSAILAALKERNG